MCCVALSPDRRTAATGSGDGVCRLWDARRGRSLASLEGHTESILCLTFTADGRRLATGSADTTTVIWDARKKKRVTKFEGRQTRGICGVAFSPDAATLATASEDYSCCLWSVAERFCMATFRGHLDGLDASPFPRMAHFLPLARWIRHVAFGTPRRRKNARGS